jgi:hypothetical protein
LDTANAAVTKLLKEPLFVKGTGFTGCGKTKFFEGDGLQAVRK